MKVVVGLGNPGSKFSGTRHNIGFEVIDYLAKSPLAGSFRAKFESQIADSTEGGQQLLLVKPETFMNLSGQAVKQIKEFYKLELTDLMIICDDIALPIGKLRIKAKGSHGGQNGLRNIEAHLGTNGFNRLRIGVGDTGGIDAAAYVLSRFKSGERQQVEDAVSDAARAVLVWAAEGIDVCMNRFNGDPQTTKKVKKAEDQPSSKTDKKLEPGESKARPNATGNE
ncbi:aminoacyl-tRNA hydrolase [Telmatocola sphagniphila]|uniref:Peptidyl-tRNA hydrolase n=1 Tax=Telmatocola sphagniphila TaxID=1123043 RepID=A0A8E6B689_9BACT|nr:aminoacyl-tRNA hydrolase [Telmatocola sphagniphila]QVL32506.1 aminoacyl-tRNA hydrolase [Telmatocola sphagniphila]